MSERVDILLPDFTTAPFFTVDNTATNNVVPLAIPSVSPLQNADGAYTFAQGDNFIILSFGIIMPLSFQFDRSQISGKIPVIPMSFYGQGTVSGNDYYFNEISSQSAGVLYAVMENFDTTVDIFVDLQNQADGLSAPYNIKNESFNLNWTLKFIPGSGIGISMIGVPSALNGTVQYVLPYMKILHNYPLVFLP